MLTFGIDLSSQAANTATCEILWSDGIGEPLLPVLGNTDRDLIAQVGRCTVVGIDAPFGWPQLFAEFIALRQTIGEKLTPWDPCHRDRLRFRLTDYQVRDVLGRWPLSVSSDLIGVTAMRCAGLLDALGVVDYSGDGRVIEVYPAVALAAWGLPSKGLKRLAGEKRRSQCVEALATTCPWLHLSESVRHMCAASDHAFDALISSLVARAAAIGLTARPASSEVVRARIEGWIAVPQQGSLHRLISLPSDNG